MLFNLGRKARKRSGKCPHSTDKETKQEVEIFLTLLNLVSGRTKTQASYNSKVNVLSLLGLLGWRGKGTVGEEQRGKMCDQGLPLEAQMSAQHPSGTEILRG